VRKICALLGLAAVIGSVAFVPAAARADDDLNKGWDIRAGFFMPERKGPRSTQGDLFFTIGAEKSVYETERMKGTVSVDYYGSSSIYNVPVQVNLRQTTHHFRYGFGAGIGFAHDSDRGMTAFTYSLLAGYEFPTGRNPLAVDIQYHFVNGTSDLNGWALTFGGRN